MNDRVLSTARLDRMRAVMAGHVERGNVPGMVTVVSRRGEVQIDVLGILVARVAGQPLETFMRERIFEPLGMKDTAFSVPPEQRAATGFFLGGNRGWGLGMSVFLERDDVASSPGRFGWDGGYGTSWHADPAEELTAIMLSQVLTFPGELYEHFWTSVYQSLDD